MNRQQRDAETKQRAFHRVARAYADHRDARSSLLAVHAAVWSDIMAAQAVDPTFNTDNLHTLALEDAQLDTYEGFTSAAWQELWRYLIHTTLTDDVRDLWLARIPEPLTVATDPAYPDPAANPFGIPGEPVTETRTRLAAETADNTHRLYTDVMNGKMTAVEHDSEAADASAFQMFLLDRSARRNDVSYVQAEILWTLATFALEATPHRELDLRHRIVDRRARIVWTVPLGEQAAALDALPSHPLI